MLESASRKTFLILIAACGLMAQTQAARPTAEDLALRDRWIAENFPERQGSAPATAAAAFQPEAGLMAWTSLGPVVRNVLPTLPLQIADRKFDSGLFCHAPGRIGVCLPGPGKSFSAVVGILTNPASQGGSVIFSVDVGGARVFSSPVQHRGEAGARVEVDLEGAREFILSAGCAGDGLSSDQGVWGDARVVLADGKEVRLGDLPLFDPLAAARPAGPVPPFSFTYRKWITDRIAGLIESEGVDFYRQDFNMDPLYSWRDSDAEDRQGIAEIRHVEGYYAFWDDLVRRHPKIWIDSCASGGRRNDLGTLRRAVPILRSDYVADPTSEQNHIYGISFWMPYHGSGIEQVDQYWTRSLMGPIVGFGVDTRKQGWNFDLLRKLYAQVRQVQRCYLGDYYPLTPYRKDDGCWTAYQFDLPEAGEGIIHAFRRKTCPDQTIRLKLGGLEPDARYVVQDIDGGEGREAPGRELAAGLEVKAADPHTALLFTYRRKA
jgi:hypothetical protein